MKKNSSLFKFFSLKPATVFALAVATILALVLSACAPIPESERLPPLQPGYERIIVSISGVGGRAVTNEDKDTAKYKVFFNGILSETGPHGVFKVGSTVNIRVEGYRKDTDEQIGVGTASHTMIYGTNRATVTLGPVSGSYILRYSYGEAENLPGKKEGLPSGTEFYESGEEVTPPNADIVTWDHGDLAGWNYDDGSGEQPISAIPFQMPSAETKLVAQWTRHKYDLTYEDNIPDGKNGTVSGKPQNQTQQDALTKITIENATPNLTIANEAWTFKGYWTDNPEGNGTHYSSGQTITLTDNITLYAQWTNEPVWNVTFDQSSDKPTVLTTEMPTNDIVIRGETFSWTANPSATGWTFGGWDVADTGAGSVPDLSATERSYTPQGDTTLTAKWTANTYTIKLNTTNSNWSGATGTISGGQTTVNATYDTVATLPAITAPVGYTFAGWAKADGATSAALRTAITNGTVTASGNNEITLTAQWQIKTYSVTYNTGDPTLSIPQHTRTYGQSFSLNPTSVSMTRTGYSFANWTWQKAGSSSPITVTGGTSTSEMQNYDGDIEFAAVWTPNTYNITYYDVDASSSNTAFSGTHGSDHPTRHTYGTATPLVNPTTARKGFTFEGWYTDNSGTASAGNSLGATAYTTAVKLYAKWTLDNIDMVSVTGGTFTMGDGSDSNNAEWSGVTVSTFKMGKYEITQAQWKAVMGSLPTSMASTNGDAGNNPVNKVSWYDAIAFCNKLSLKEGKTPCYSVSTVSDWNALTYEQIPTGADTNWNEATCDWDNDGYRLPTEAEWEYAARGGTTLAHSKYSGVNDSTTPNPTEDDLKTVAWYDGNSGSKTHEVGTTPTPANALGISDMSGNVIEWCWDWYSNSGYASANGGNTSNPKGPSNGSSIRVVRGGSWKLDKSYTVSYRGNTSPYQRSDGYGLRLVTRQP